MHYGRMKNKNQSKMVTKTNAGSSIVVCHLPQCQTETSESLAFCHIRVVLVALSLAGQPGHLSPPFSFLLSVPLPVLPQWDSLLISAMLLTWVSLVKPSTSIIMKLLISAMLLTWVSWPSCQALPLSPLPLGRSLPWLVITCLHHHRHHCH